MRITHRLEADILPTDIITFDLSFDSASANVEKVDVIKEDSGRCVVSQNTMDTTYWVQEAYDGYWFENVSDSTWLWSSDAYAS
jgi:hypothetical protein